MKVSVYRFAVELKINGVKDLSLYNKPKKSLDLCPNEEIKRPSWLHKCN